MLNSLGNFVVRRRKGVIATTLLLAVLAGGLGGGVAKRLSVGGFEDRGSESSRSKAALEQVFGRNTPNVVLLVDAKSGSVDDPRVRARGKELTKKFLSQPHVKSAVSYWDLPIPQLRNKDSSRAIILGVIDGSDDDVEDSLNHMGPLLRVNDNVISVGIGGRSQVYTEADNQTQDDLAKAEMIALPITLILLVIVFGGVVAGAVPLIVGVLSIMGTFLVLFLLSLVLDVSIYAMNLATAMGLGLAIDYALFIVSRYREEIGKGHSPHDAVVITVTTTGRTIVGSAVTVAISFAAMLLFPLTFLRSFAYSGMAVSLLAAAGAVVFLPALLAIVGDKIDSLRLWRRKSQGERSVWSRVAANVMRHPLVIAVPVTALLIGLGAPFFHMRIGFADDRSLPEGAPVRQVNDVLREEFASDETGAMQVVTPEGGSYDLSAQTRYASQLSKIAGVARVDSAAGTHVDGNFQPLPEALTKQFSRSGSDLTWMKVVLSVDPLSRQAERIVKDIRDSNSPVGEVLVGGSSAEQLDSKSAITETLPWAGAWIVVATFVLLFLMFGSVVVPLKALLLNFLSLTATFGAMVWIFQEGHLSGVLDFTATGSLMASMPILMFCITFGLSMDYEVFLLSRIKEEHDRSGDNERSVASGLERTGGIVTAAAVLMSVVFIAFSTSGVSFMKLFGVGLALAVLMDAFVIRATLVPAFMKLAGELNWWAPAPLRRFHERFGINESGNDSPQQVGLIVEP